MLFILVTPTIFLAAPFLVITGVTCLGSSFVLLNSFLPLLAVNHPQAQSGNAYELRASSSSGEEPQSSTSRIGDTTESEHGLIYDHTMTRQSSSSRLLKLSTQISAKGIGFGYAAAVLVQALSILLLYLMSKTSVSSTLPLRLVLLMVGFLWFGGTFLCGKWLRDWPGPPLSASHSHRNTLRSCLTYVSFAWQSLWKTLKMVSKLPQAMTFLFAWFLLSDAVATVSGTAVLFARTELKMDNVQIALLSITATSSGIAGAFIWPIISRRYALKTNRTIVTCMALMEIIPLYGLMGYIPFVQSWQVGGLQQAWEIYPLALIHGFVMGGLGSYCRSFYSLLIPPGSEAAFFALYAITDKGSSAVGPAIVGLIVDATGTIRPAFLFLAILIALPIPLILMVSAEKGQEDALRMAGAIKKTGDNEDLDELVDGTWIQEADGLLRDHD
jgi:UMF1 family MFS transporter